MFDLIKEFEAITPIPDDAQLFILRHLKEERFGKNKYLLQAGQVCRYLYFIREGIVCGFFKHYGKDHVMRFVQNQEICLVPESFLKQTPSRENLQAIIESSVYALSFDTIHKACRLWPKFHMILNHYLSQQVIEATNCLYMLRSLDSFHRYKWIKGHFSQKKIPVKKMASYIGLSDRSLYRLSRRDSRKPPLQ